MSTYAPALSRRSALVAIALLAVWATLTATLGTAAAATTTVGAGENLGAIAARHGVSVQALAAHNGITDPNRVIAGTVLRLPGSGSGATGGSSTGLTVGAGENLGTIAARHGVSVEALAAHNGISNPNRVIAGTVLRLPAAGVTTSAGPSAPAGGAITVGSGENLGTIAARHGVSVQALAAHNGITNPNRVIAGTALRLPAAGARGATITTGASGVSVGAGENLGAIAARHGVSVNALAAHNGITNPNRVIAGTVLKVPAAGASGGAGPSGVTVRSGESLGAIAARHGVSVQALAAHNGIADPNRVIAGTVLRVPSTGSAPSGMLPRGGSVAQLLDAAAARHGVDPRLVRAIAWQESGWNQGAVSPVGAVGVMQLMPETARWIGSDLLGRRLNQHALADNIDGGAAFLSWLLRRSGNSETAVASYYQGLSSVQRIGYYDDTRDYVSNVFSLRGRM